MGILSGPDRRSRARTTRRRFVGSIRPAATGSSWRRRSYSFSVSGSAQAVYSERSDKFDPQASALVSWKNADETFGVLVGGVYQKRRTRRDGVEILGYTATTVAGQMVQVPSLIGSALFEQKRERYGGNIELQFKPSDTLEIVATGLYSRFNADNFNRNFMAWGSNALGGGGTLTFDISGVTDLVGTLVDPSQALRSTA